VSGPASATIVVADRPPHPPQRLQRVDERPHGLGHPLDGFIDRPLEFFNTLSCVSYLGEIILVRGLAGGLIKALMAQPQSMCLRPGLLARLPS
jgi:hypothetical protein